MRSTDLPLRMARGGNFFRSRAIVSLITHPLVVLNTGWDANRRCLESSPAGSLTKLYKDNAATLTPDPLHSAFYDSHPPALERISRLQRMALAGDASHA